MLMELLGWPHRVQGSSLGVSCGHLPRALGLRGRVVTNSMTDEWKRSVDLASWLLPQGQHQHQTQEMAETEIRARRP